MLAQASLPTWRPGREGLCCAPSLQGPGVEVGSPVVQPGRSPTRSWCPLPGHALHAPPSHVTKLPPPSVHLRECSPTATGLRVTGTKHVSLSQEGPCRHRQTRRWRGVKSPGGWAAVRVGSEVTPCGAHGSATAGLCPDTVVGCCWCCRRALPGQHTPYGQLCGECAAVSVLENHRPARLRSLRARFSGGWKGGWPGRRPPGESPGEASAPGLRPSVQACCLSPLSC